MFTKSIRWRLQLWLAFLLVCVLAGFGATSYQLHRVNRLSQIDDELARRVAALSGDLRGPSPPGRPPEWPPFRPGTGPPPPLFGPPEMNSEQRTVRLSPATAGLFNEAETNSFYYTLWSRTGTLLKRSTNAPADLQLPARLEADTQIHLRLQGVLREAYHFTEMGDCVLAGRSIARDLAGLRRFAWLLAAAGGVVLALGLGGGWRLASRALRPVEQISAAANRISVGNLAERINVAETDSELGRLAGVLNSTFARLEAAFAQQKQFTADASHELRTPIAVIISEAQTTLARDRSAAEYRETVESCLHAAQQMRRLTQSLLELARFDAGQEPIQRRPFDLAESTRGCVDLIQPLAGQRGIRIRCDLRPAPISGDADRVSQVVLNLLSNAVQFNSEQGRIDVATRLEDGAAVLTIADTGMGIAPEDRPHIFERFYRGDKSRAAANGRTGLGLAICKAVVDAHGGSIAVSSQPGAGTTFTVTLPA